MPYLLGIDSGLTVTKAVLFDLSGKNVAIARRRVEQILPQPRHVERNMDSFWSITASAIKEVIEKSGCAASDILAIGTTAHGDGIYLLDQAKKPLGNAILSLDSRAGEICDEWSAHTLYDAVLHETGQIPHASAPSALLAWIKRHDPERYKKIGSILACKDWLNFCLTGRIGTDRTEASTSFTNVYTQEYTKESLTLFDLQDMWQALPDVTRSDSLLGTVTSECALQTGLCAGTPVVAGLHDVTASALGIGGLSVGTVALITGTYSINETLSKEAKINKNWFCRNGILPGEWNAMSISPASTTTYDWFLESVCNYDQTSASKHGPSIHEKIEMDVEKALDKPSSLFFHPYLFGSPYGATASGSFIGLRGWHTRNDMIRAIWEGIAFNHRVHTEYLKSGFSIKNACLTGGVSRSPVFSNLFSNIIGMPIYQGTIDEAAAWGAAICAGVYAGVFTSVYETPISQKEAPFFNPTLSIQKEYEKRYALFFFFFESMKTLWPDIEDFS